MLYINEDGLRGHVRRCAWTCAWSLLAAVATFAFLLWGPEVGDDALACVSLVLTVSVVMFAFAMLLMLLSLLLVCLCREISRRSERDG